MPVGCGEAKVILHAFSTYYLVGVVVLESKRVLGASTLKLNFVAVEMWHNVMWRWALVWLVKLGEFDWALNLPSFVTYNTKLTD